MSMRPLWFGPQPPPGAPVAVKVDWCMRALVEIQRWSNENSAATIAQGFTVTNLTATRTYDADSTSTAELADVLGTVLSDLAKGGAKRT